MVAAKLHAKTVEAGKTRMQTVYAPVNRSLLATINSSSVSVL